MCARLSNRAVFSSRSLLRCRFSSAFSSRCSSACPSQFSDASLSLGAQQYDFTANVVPYLQSFGRGATNNQGICNEVATCSCATGYTGAVRRRHSLSHTLSVQPSIGPTSPARTSHPAFAHPVLLAPPFCLPLVLQNCDQVATTTGVYVNPGTGPVIANLGGGALGAAQHFVALAVAALLALLAL